MRGVETLSSMVSLQMLKSLDFLESMMKLWYVINMLVCNMLSPTTDGYNRLGDK